MTNFETLQSELKTMLNWVYPDIQIRVEPWAQDPAQTAIYFEEPTFAPLYPMQRYHYLTKLIPKDYFDQYLADTVWFELAPGEDPAGLEYPDEELIAAITPDVMKCVHASGFLKALDDAFCPSEPTAPRAKCHGDFRLAKELLLKHRFKPDEFFDVLHVLMAKGGYCDCEILYNVAEESRLKEEYWKARSQGLKAYNPHLP